MNLIIIEGPDRVGKDTLISNLTGKIQAYLNVHFISPPQGIKDPLNYQFDNPFKSNLNLTKCCLSSCDIELAIWNRSHLGEYVYGQIYRNYDPEVVLKRIWSFERELLLAIPNDQIYLINLFASADYLIKNDDGNSFTTEKEKKQRELDLFQEVHNHSIIRNKYKFDIQIEDGTLKNERYIAESIKTRFNFNF